jgi:hypothetical protein
MEDAWGIEGSASLVSTMDSIWVHTSRAHKMCVKEWVKTNGIKPRFKVGDTVNFCRWQSTLKPVNKGEVIEINKEEGRYSIYSEELGHVREGNGTRASICNWEDVDREEMNP